MTSKMTRHLKLAAVILDGSGTICDPGVYAPMEVFREVFKQKNVPITVHEARQPMGNHKKRHIELITQMPDVRRRWRAQHWKFPDCYDVEEMFELYKPMQLKTLEKYGQVIPGTLETLENLRSRNVITGLTTGFTREMVNRILAVNPSLRLDCTVAADEVSVARPAPFMIYKNMECLRVLDPYTVLKVDDTEMGMMEGTYAKCWNVGLVRYSNLMGMSEDEVKSFEKRDPSGYQHKYRIIADKLITAGAHFICPDITSVPAVIDSINDLLKNGIFPHDSCQARPSL